MLVENFRNIYNKNVVLLQGPIGWFFNELEEQLNYQNNHTFRILFNAGDEYFCTSENALPFKEDISVWADYFDSFLISEEIDVVIMQGDLRAFHKIAKKIAKDLNKEVYVFEQGYLRPNFITFEKDGVNANSKTIPKSKGIFEKIEFSNSYKDNIQKKGVEIKNNFYYTAKYSIIYGFLNSVLSYKYPLAKKYNIYKINFFKDILKFVYGKIKIFLNKSNTKKILKNVATVWDNNYYFIPLQLNEDSQVKVHSTYNDMNEFIKEVIISFSKHSEKDKKLIIKEHPLGVGLVNNEQYIKELVKHYGVEDRVFYIIDGELGLLLKHTKGTVTINSTVGMSTLYHLKPLKTLGKSIFSIDGLASTDLSLDEFWKNCSIPNEKLVSNFINYVLYYTQMKGSFYIPKNIIKNSGK